MLLLVAGDAGRAKEDEEEQEKATEGSAVAAAGAV